MYFVPYAIIFSAKNAITIELIKALTDQRTFWRVSLQDTEYDGKKPFEKNRSNKSEVIKAKSWIHCKIIQIHLRRKLKISTKTIIESNFIFYFNRESFNFYWSDLVLTTLKLIFRLEEEVKRRREGGDRWKKDI